MASTPMAPPGAIPVGQMMPPRSPVPSMVPAGPLPPVMAQAPQPMAYQPMPAASVQNLSYVPPQQVSYPSVVAGSRQMLVRPGGELEVYDGVVPSAPMAMMYSPQPQYAQVPSYVAPPQPMVAPASYVSQPPPGQPPCEGMLTRGMPDPTAVDEQKSVYSRALDQELQKSIQAIQERNAMEKKLLAQAAQQQKAMHEMQVDQMVQGQTAMLDEQRNMQLLGLQQEAMNQKIGLENQAAGLKLEYEQRKAQEEMMFKQYELQKVHYEAQSKAVQQQTDFAAMQMQQASVVQSPVVPPAGAMFAMPAAAPPRTFPMVPSPAMTAGQLPQMGLGPQMLVEQGGFPYAMEQAAAYGSAPAAYAAAPVTYMGGGQSYQAPVAYMQQTPSYVGAVAAAYAPPTVVG